MATHPNRPWPKLRIGEVLSRSDHWIDVDPTERYREVTVRLWGRGVTLRRLALGAEIKVDRRIRVRHGQFILSRIDARNGAFGLVPPELDGAVVSNDFPVFDIREDRLRPEFLGWLSRTPGFVDACRAASEGTTNRVRLKEDHFLRSEISVPPLPEQRRIVAKIDQLAAKIAEARGLRADATDERSFLLGAGMRSAFGVNRHWPVVPLEDVCAEITDCLHSNPVYAEGGVPTIRSPDVGWGQLDLDRALRTSETEYQRRTRRGELKAGDIVLVREGGGTGKAGMVQNGQRFSLGQRVMMLRPDTARVEPSFLLYQWLSPLIYQEQIVDRTKGSASPHLNIKVLRRFDFLLPPLDEQRRIVAYLDDLQAKVDRLKELQTQTAAELDALLPAILDKAFKGEL